MSSASHRRSKKSASSGASHLEGSNLESGDGIKTIWQSLGRLKAELRKIDHRLEDVGNSGDDKPTTITEAVAALTRRSTEATVAAASTELVNATSNNLSREGLDVGCSTMPGVSSGGEKGADGTSRRSNSANSSNHTGARRKVSRIDEKKVSSRKSGHHKSTSTSPIPDALGGRRGREPLKATHNSQKNQGASFNANHTGGSREDSLKRVDFSKTHQLREVNWDGTYQDSLAYPVEDATLTNSRDIRDTNINFLNFSRVPGNPPSSSAADAASALASKAKAGAHGAGSTRNYFGRSDDAVANNLNNNARSSGSGTSTCSSSPSAPPPSASNSNVNCGGVVLPPQTSSSSSTSVMSQENQRHHHHHHHHHHSSQQHRQISSSSSSSATDHHYSQPSNHLHHPHHQQPPPDVRWTSTDHIPKTVATSSSHHPSSRLASAGVTNQASSSSNVPLSSAAPSSGKHKLNKGPKLTGVDLKVVQGSKSSSNSGSARTALLYPYHREPSTNAAPATTEPSSLEIRRRVDDKWATSSSLANHVRGGSSADADHVSQRAHAPFDPRAQPLSNEDSNRWSSEPSRPPVFGAGGRLEGRSDMDELLGAVGGAFAHSDAGEPHSPRRPLPMKKAITADLKDDEIMMKLKERLKQQRAMASSSSASGSNDTSFADSSSSQAPALPPRQPLLGDSVPPRPRKIAAAHPAPGYKGFSVETNEQNQKSVPDKANAKSGGGVKKKFSGPGSSKRQPPLIQPKKHEVEGAVASTRHAAPPAPEQRSKKARLIASSSSDKKSSKSGAKNIITTSSWRAGQELVMKELGLVLPAKAKTKSSTSHDDHEGQGHDRRLKAPEGSSSRTRGREHDGAEDDDDDDGGGGAIGTNSGTDDPLVNEVVAKSKTLSDDTKHMLQELQLGNINDLNKKDKEKNSHRPPKRKASKSAGKAESDTDKQQQPCEKTRHYDADSVRKFMAKQKAERLKRQQEEKQANQRANERRQQMMEKLAETQKVKVTHSASGTAARIIPVADIEMRKKRKDTKGVSKSNKENSEGGEDHDDDSTLTGETEDDLTPQATPREEKNDEATKQKRHPLSQQEIMEWSAGVHTSIPNTRVNPTAPSGVSSQGAQSSHPRGTTIEFKGQMLNLDLDNVFNRFSQVVNQRAANSAGKDLPHTTVTSSASHPVPAPRHIGSSNGVEGAPPFDLGTVNSVCRTNEERKQAIKATALTLHNRLAQERRRLEDVKVEPHSTLQPGPSHPHSTSQEEHIPRYERIAGSGDSFSVFTSRLPGSQVGLGSRSRQDVEQEAAARIQAAYRGHSVRGALDWELPSSGTLGHRLRGIGHDKKPVQTEERGGGDASELTDTSVSFSDITVTDNENQVDPANVAGNRRAPQRHRRHAEGSTRKPSGGQGQGHRAAASSYQPPPSDLIDMPEPKADPHSVMSIFSRQSKYLAAGSMKADMPASTITSSMTRTTTTTTSANAAQFAEQDFTYLKQPVMTHHAEHTLHTHTASGQPLVASTRYTRFEATIPDNDASSSASESATAHARGGVSGSMASRHSQSHHGRSNEASAKGDKVSRQSSHKSGRPDAYTMSFESDDDEDEDEVTLTASIDGNQSGAAAGSFNNDHMMQPSNKPGGTASYNRQMSDAGQETDVSQMSEDEPRVMRSKFEGSGSQRASAATNRGQGEVPPAQGPGHTVTGRLSPNSLANKLSAGLTHLESMEESLRQVVGMERVRAVALAQQETVSLAQVLKARQQEHSNELRQLQTQVQQEANEATQQLEGMRARPSVAALLRKEDNLRPESRTVTPVSALSYSSPGRPATGREDLSQSPGNRRIKRSSATASLASVTRVSSSRSSRDRSSTTAVKTAVDSSDSSIKSVSDAEGADSRTASSIAEDISGADRRKRRGDDDDDDDDDVGSYSMSFDDSVTDEESFRQVLPSESHRKEAKQQEMSNASIHHDASSNNMSAYGDLSSLFVGEDSFNKFTAEMVRQIMREEEYRAQHQAALLSLREKALREKAKAELAWLQQLKKKPLDRRADDVFPNIDKREKRIRKNLQEQQAEIRRLQEANKKSSQERQRLLQQHEEIARIKQNTNNTMKKLNDDSPTQGRLARPSEVHTEDEVEASDVNEDVKDSKSDSEMYKDVSPSKKSKGDKKSIEKQRKLRLDQKYMTAREQKLYDRKKQAEELLEWKRRLDAEEAEVYRLERQAMNAWEGKDGAKKDKTDRRDKEKINKKAPTPKQAVATSPSRRGVPSAATADDVSTAAISEHMSSAHDETTRKEVSFKTADNLRKGGKAGGATGKGRSQTVQGSISEVISTQLSLSQSDSESHNNKSRTKTSVIASASGATAQASGAGKSKQRSGTATTTTSNTASGSESSIPEEVPSAASEGKKKAHDSSDDTIINSSANDEYADTFEHDVSASARSASAKESQRKKSPVGKLLPQGNSPLPTPWSRKTGSESESEDSISHTETMSDASDYEVRIRQLGDELRRRRKEVEILKKERSRRKKEKFRAQEVALKKQLDAYNTYIQQLKEEKDDLEHEPSPKTAVRPQIKQPGAKALSSGSPGARPGVGRHGEDVGSNSSSFEDMREGTDSNQSSPAVDKKDVKPAVDEKAKKKAAVSLMDRISEGSESDKSAPSRKGKAKPDTKPLSKPHDDNDASEKSSSSMQEVIDEASQLDSVMSTEKNSSSAALKIKTSIPVKKDNKQSNNNGMRSLKDEDASYSLDFSEAGSTLAQNHGRGGLSSAAKDLSMRDGSEAGDISEHIMVEDQSSVASAPKSPTSVSNQLKFDFRAGSKPGDASREASVASGPHSIAESIPPSTGIQESDSETESRVNSYHTSAKSEASSRPSSERSVGSMSYSAEDDDEENDQERQLHDQEEQEQVVVTPVGKTLSEKSLPPVPGAKAQTSASKATEEDISEQISGSLPSISERHAGGSLSNSLPKDSQDILDNLLGYEGGRREEEDEDDKTPVPTPREMLPLDDEEEENLSLLMTDPLADFTLGDKVLVFGGQKCGILRYKGKVDFSPGIWAGVELDQPVGDHDGMQEGTRYFNCKPKHGVIVQGSDIISSADREKEGGMAREELSGVGGILNRQRLSSSEGRSPDESLTTEDSKADEALEDGERTVLPAQDESMLHSTPLASPNFRRNAGDKPTATPVKKDAANTLLADAITEQLEASLVQESLEEVVGRLSAHSSPAKKGSAPPLPSSPPPSEPKPELGQSLDRFELPEDQSPEVTRKNQLNKLGDKKLNDIPSEIVSPKHKTERTTDGVMRSLLDEAITDMVKIRKNKVQTMSNCILEEEKHTTKLNGDLHHKDKQALLTKPGLGKKDNEFVDDDSDDDDDSGDDEKIKDNDSGLSLDHMHRPSSPVPGESATDNDRNKLKDDMDELFGEYIDDDLGFQQQTETASKTEQALERSSYSVPEEIPPVVPHTKDEITPIVSRAVDVFWTSRRYGESLNDVQPPDEFLAEWDDEDNDDEASSDPLTQESRRSWKRMLFDLTGEIVRDIYQDENKPDPPVWQKAQHRSHKFFKGSKPPSTVDALKPVVHKTINGLLDLDQAQSGGRGSGPGSKAAGQSLVNKWNVRKKKDAVDTVLVSELAREEKGWVNYDEDELNLKNALADSLFDSLLADTVSTLNGISKRRNPSQV